MEERQCTRCGQVKPVAEFSKRAGMENAYRSQCKACRSAAVIASRAKRKAAGAPGAPGAPEPDKNRAKRTGAPGAPRTPGAPSAPSAPSAPKQERGAKYGAGWVKRGLIVRADHLARLQEQAWRERTDLTAVLDRALGEYLKDRKGK